MLPLIPSRGLRLRDPEVGRTEVTVQFNLLSSLMKLRANLHTQIVPWAPGASGLLLFLLLTQREVRCVYWHHSWFILMNHVTQSLNNKGTGKPLHTLNVTCSSTMTFTPKGHLLSVFWEVIPISGDCGNEGQARVPLRAEGWKQSPQTQEKLAVGIADSLWVSSNMEQTSVRQPQLGHLQNCILFFYFIGQKYIWGNAVPEYSMCALWLVLIIPSSSCLGAWTLILIFTQHWICETTTKVRCLLYHCLLHP